METTVPGQISVILDCNWDLTLATMWAGHGALANNRQKRHQRPEALLRLAVKEDLEPH